MTVYKKLDYKVTLILALVVDVMQVFVQINFKKYESKGKGMATVLELF